MPDGNYQIGDFSFLDLQGAPQRLGTAVEVHTYPGFNSATAWHMGLQPAQPFRMRSIAAVANALAGKTLYSRYLQAKGFVANSVVWQGSEAYQAIEASSPLPALAAVKMMVIDVQMVDCRAASVPVGFSGGGILVCDWTLLPWMVEEEE